MSIHKIVITGGPGAGKTTGQDFVIKELGEKKGYTILFVAETATELIKGGITPVVLKSADEFQTHLLDLQMKKEEVYMKAAKQMEEESGGKKKILIICDRGALDNKAYMTTQEFSKVLSEINTSEVELRDTYDAVFHLMTPAKYAPKFYTTKNNSARTETIEEAAALDDKLIAAWTGHPHFRVIDNSDSFEGKMKNLLNAILSFLGEPLPLEIERKYLIEYPDTEFLLSLPYCQKVEMMQTYLLSDGDDEFRIRQRGMDGNYVYFCSEKRDLSDLTRIDIEKRISKEEYLSLLMKADPNKKSIRKDRYLVMENGKYYEIDVYPNWNNQAIMEIELESEDESVPVPPYIKIIKEVTSDFTYRNANLADM